eukprot:m.179374 g.179374  ORF g.179374 m.179374 type:complete len:833 (+) comp18391_c0_seq1:392-2890(+)
MSDKDFRECALCHLSLVKGSYSKRQWSRGFPISKCAKCCTKDISGKAEIVVSTRKSTTLNNGVHKSKTPAAPDTTTTPTTPAALSEEDDTDIECVNAVEHADPLETGDATEPLDSPSAGATERQEQAKRNHFHMPANVWKGADDNVSNDLEEDPKTVQQLTRELARKSREIAELQRLLHKSQRNMFLWTSANFMEETGGDRLIHTPSVNLLDQTAASTSAPSQQQLATPLKNLVSSPTSTQPSTCAFCCNSLPHLRPGVPPPRLVWPPRTAADTPAHAREPKRMKRRRVAAVPASTVVGVTRELVTANVVDRDATVQCAACAEVGFALYCSEEHLIADRPRHTGECTAMRQHSVKRYLRQGRTAMVQALANRKAMYKFGLCEDDTKRVVATRTLTPAGKTCRRGNDDEGVLLRSPIADYLARTRAGCEVALEAQEIGTAVVLQRLQQQPRIVAPPGTSVYAPCRPWVSYCSPTSVVLNWLPPVVCGRFGVREYIVQIATRCPSSTTDAPTWEAWETLRGETSADLEAHSGLNTSHIVRGLSTGTKYRFRVGATRHEPQYTIIADKCGYRTNGALGVAGERSDGEVTWSPPSDITTAGMADASMVEDSGETAHGAMGFTAKEMQFFKSLDTAGKVQDYLDSLPLNHEAEDDTCLSALEAVRQNHAHCIEAAMLGAYILSLHGHAPFLLDLRASSSDDDHIVTPFMLDGRWGCLSKSNHAALRYRNPVYLTLRELVMSYFDDYLSKDGVRSLRSYSLPIHLDAVFGHGWPFVRGDVGHIAGFMDAVPHFRLCEREHLGNLRPGDAFMTTGQVTQREWHQPANYSAVALQRNLNK